MAPRNDFEKRYFDQLDKRFDAIDEAIKANTKTTKEGFRFTNQRIDRLDSAVFPEKKETIQQLPSVWRDPQFIKLLLAIVIFGTFIAVIVASLKGIKLPQGLF